MSNEMKNICTRCQQVEPDGVDYCSDCGSICCYTFGDDIEMRPENLPVFDNESETFNVEKHDNYNKNVYYRTSTKRVKQIAEESVIVPKEFNL